MFGLETKTMNFGEPNPNLLVNPGEIIAFCFVNDFQCHLNPTPSIVRSYSERHRPPIPVAQLGNCLGEAKAHTQMWNRNAQNAATVFPASTDATCVIAGSIHSTRQTCKVFYTL